MRRGSHFHRHFIDGAADVAHAHAAQAGRISEARQVGHLLDLVGVVLAFGVFQPKAASSAPVGWCLSFKSSAL